MRFENELYEAVCSAYLQLTVRAFGRASNKVALASKRNKCQLILEFNAGHL